MTPETVRRMLDSDEAARLIGRLQPELSLRDLKLESVWAKPARHCNVCYRVTSDDGPRLVSLCAVADREARAALERSPLRPAPGVVHARAALVADGILAQAFPFDYRLPHLEAHADPRAAQQVLGGGVVDRCEVAAYRAGMRCQLRFLSGGLVRAYGKTSVERDPGRRRRVHRELSMATSMLAMRVPPLLGSVEPGALDLVAAVGGRSLYDVLANGGNRPEVSRVAAALGELHASVPPPDDRRHTTDDELALASSWAQWIGELEPSLEPLLTRVTGSLTHSVPRSDAIPSFVHRDFYDRQVLVEDERLWLLDVDTACAGDPELDLGNLLAHLVLRALQWNRLDSIRALEATVKHAYGRPVRDDLLYWYRSASLLRLACVYQLRPHWRGIVASLLDEARQP